MRVYPSADREYSVAMGRAIQLDEESIVRSIVDSLELPPGVNFKRVEQSSDWEGIPALRVYFTVSQALKLTPKHVASLILLPQRLQRAVVDSGIEKWAYIHFQEVK